MKSALPALALAIAVLVPFLDKPFTIDDTVFLMEARHALADPLHPTAFNMNWDHAYERVSAIVPTGPVIAWLLTPSVALGGRESVAHLVELAALLVAALATVSLAIRLGLGQWWAAASGLLVVSTPVALGMAGTAMPDVPAMALGVVGIERLVGWRDERRPHQAILAALFLGLAAMTRTHLVLLFGVSALFLARDPFSWVEWKGSVRRWLPLLGGAFLAALIAVLTRDPGAGGGNIATTAAHYSSLASVASNLVAFDVHLALATTFALTWVVLRWSSVKRLGWLFAGGTAAAALLLHVANGEQAPYAVAPVAGLGLVALADVLVDAWRRRDALQLALGAWLLLPLPIVIYVQMPSKYLVGSVPAAAILVARAMSERRDVGRVLLAVATACGVAAGLAILSADSAMAEVGRTAAQKLIAPQVAAGRRVWYVGHWGFQWYAEKAGARCWSSEPPDPVEGDLIAADWDSSWPLAEELRVLTPLGRIEDRHRGFRVMSREKDAGFFSNTWGYLPLAWDDGVIDSVDLWLAVRRDGISGADVARSTGVARENPRR